MIQLSEFKEIPGLVHGFTTKGEGTDKAVIKEELGIDSAIPILSLNQIHSKKVVVVEGANQNLPDADAFVTNVKNVIIGVRTADCLPLLVCDLAKKVVAAIHAGHKGLRLGIIEETWHVMQSVYGCKLDDTMWLLGPSICIDHFEVGEDFLHDYKSHFGGKAVYNETAQAKPHIDLKGTMKNVLMQLGVNRDQVFDTNLCTFERKDLFNSYRRDKSEGRQFSFIGFVE